MKKVFLAVLSFVLYQGVIFSQTLLTKSEGDITYQYYEDEYGRIVKQGTYSKIYNKPQYIDGVECNEQYSERCTLKNNFGDGPFSYSQKITVKGTGVSYATTASGGFKEGIFDGKWAITKTLNVQGKVTTQNFSVTFYKGIITHLQGTYEKSGDKYDFSFTDDTVLSGSFQSKEYGLENIKKNLVVYSDPQKTTILEKIHQLQLQGEETDVWGPLYEYVAETGYMQSHRHDKIDVLKIFQGYGDVFLDAVMKFISREKYSSDSKYELVKNWEYNFLESIEYATFDEVEAEIKRAGLDQNNWSSEQYDFYNDFLLERQVRDKYVPAKIYEGIKKLYALDTKANEYERILKEKTNNRFNEFVRNPYSIENYLKRVCNEYKIYTESASTSYIERGDIVNVKVPCAVYYANFNNTGQPAVKREVFQVSITADNKQTYKLLTRTDLPQEEEKYKEKLLNTQTIDNVENYLKKTKENYSDKKNDGRPEITPLYDYEVLVDTYVVKQQYAITEVQCKIIKKNNNKAEIWTIPFVLNFTEGTITYDFDRAQRSGDTELEKEYTKQFRKDALKSSVNGLMK